jgi:hypothetical protein
MEVGPVQPTREALDRLSAAVLVLTRPPASAFGIAEPAPAAQAPQSSPIDLATVLRLAGSGAEDIDLARAAAMEAANLAEAEQARALPFLAPRVGFFRHEGLTQDTGGAFLDVDKQNAFAGTGVAVVLQPSDAIYRSLAVWAERTEMRLANNWQPLPRTAPGPQAHFQQQMACCQSSSPSLAWRNVQGMCRYTHRPPAWLRATLCRHMAVPATAQEVTVNKLQDNQGEPMKTVTIRNLDMYWDIAADIQFPPGFDSKKTCSPYSSVATAIR